VSTARRLVVAAVVLAVLVSAWFAVIPTVTEKEGELVPTPNGGVENRREELTYVDAHGEWVIIFLLAPIALCAAPLVKRTTTAATVCGSILVAFGLLMTLFSTIGAYYLPSALLILVAAGLVETGILEGDPT
jgi:hypothetical protein